MRTPDRILCGRTNPERGWRAADGHDDRKATGIEAAVAGDEPATGRRAVETPRRPPVCRRTGRARSLPPRLAVLCQGRRFQGNLQAAISPCPRCCAPLGPIDGPGAS